MNIRVKLMGVLKDKTPPNGELNVNDAGTIRDVLLALDIPPETVQVFTVNGNLERDQSRSLVENDDLAVLPPVGGG